MAMVSNDRDFLMDESSVLAFLADCEIEDEGSPRPTVSTKSTQMQCEAVTTTWSDGGSSISSAEKKPQEKKKSWRQRRKDEVLTLREVVKQLSTELERLKMAAGVRSTLPHSKQVITAVALKAQAVHKTETALMWEKVAGRQSMLRLSSEEKNAKLRESVTLHLQQAKSLQRSIKRKLREDMMSSSMDLIREHRLNTRGVTPPLNNKAVFDQLMDGMDGAHQGVDGFFEQEGIYSLPCPGRRNNRPNSNLTKGLYVQFLDNYAVPFDIQETAKVIWTPEKQRWEDDRLLFFQEFSTGKNTRMKSVSFVFSLKEMKFPVTMRTVMRKYTEQDRTVFITRRLIEAVYEGISVSLVETMRMVLKRGDLSAVGPTTVMQTHREAFLCDDLTGMDPTKYPNFECGLEYWESKLIHYNNSVEDQLIRTTS